MAHTAPQAIRAPSQPLRLLGRDGGDGFFLNTGGVLWICMGEYLVGGFKHGFYDLPFSWECHHPN